MDTKLIIAAVALAGLYYTARQTLQNDEPTQETSLVDDALITLDTSTYEPAAVTPDTAQTNIKAFLDMIAYAEGTGDRYDILFGGGTFASYADHPRQYFNFRNSKGETLRTTAAGRYQFLARTWDALKSKLDLPDFGPDSQDAGAIELIRQRGALNDVAAGRLTTAIQKCAPVWASLPGAGYAQPERKLSALIGAYANAGGATA